MPADHRQTDLFGATQPDLFGGAEPELAGAVPGRPGVFRGDPDRVRGRLAAIIAEARAADTMPWTRNDLACFRTIVPQMTLWLPEDEAAQWRLAFEHEVERLAA